METGWDSPEQTTFLSKNEIAFMKKCGRRSPFFHTKRVRGSTERLVCPKGSGDEWASKTVQPTLLPSLSLPHTHQNPTYAKAVRMSSSKSAAGGHLFSTQSGCAGVLKGSFARRAHTPPIFDRVVRPGRETRHRPPCPVDSLAPQGAHSAEAPPKRRLCASAAFWIKTVIRARGGACPPCP